MNRLFVLFNSGLQRISFFHRSSISKTDYRFLEEYHLLDLPNLKWTSFDPCDTLSRTSSREETDRLVGG